MFYLGFFIGYVIGILSALLFLYLVRRETESVADGERLCSKKENSVRWADTFYVEVETGKYHFASDLIKEYGRLATGLHTMHCRRFASKVKSKCKELATAAGEVW